MVQVFGDVGELREKAEGARDCRNRAVVETGEQRFELASRARITLASEPDCSLADVLDQLEDRHAFLLTQRVAEQAAEKPDVLAQTRVRIRRRRRLIVVSHERALYSGSSRTCAGSMPTSTGSPGVNSTLPEKWV